MSLKQNSLYLFDNTIRFLCILCRSISSRPYWEPYTHVVLAHLCICCFSNQWPCWQSPLPLHSCLSPDQSAVRRIVKRIRVVLSPRLLSSLYHPPSYFFGSFVFFLTTQCQCKLAEILYYRGIPLTMSFVTLVNSTFLQEHLYHCLMTLW